MKITLRNNWHQRQVIIDADIGSVLSQSQVRRVDGLCGIEGCACRVLYPPCYTHDQITRGVSLVPIFTDAGKSYRVLAS
jgi:hypothetical protein